MLMEEMEKEPRRKPGGTTTEISPDGVQSKDWLVVMCDQNLAGSSIKNLPRCPSTFFFHPHGPTVRVQQIQRRRDVCRYSENGILYNYITFFLFTF